MLGRNRDPKPKHQQSDPGHLAGAFMDMLGRKMDPKSMNPPQSQCTNYENSINKQSTSRKHLWIRWVAKSTRNPWIHLKTNAQIVKAQLKNNPPRQSIYGYFGSQIQCQQISWQRTHTHTHTRTHARTHAHTQTKNRHTNTHTHTTLKGGHSKAG